MSVSGEPAVHELIDRAQEAVPRLEFIEGLRGIAALVVCLGHLLFAVPVFVYERPIWTATPLQAVLSVFRPGTEMVYLFLMVSGFALAYSEDRRRAAGRPGTSLRTFFRRRAWRILPVYYLAVGFGLLAIAVRPRVSLAPAPILNLVEPVTWSGLLLHLPLLHNFDGRSSVQINSPLWSMAYEAQLYLVFPLLYAAMRRWNPVLVAVAAALPTEIVTHFLGVPVFGLMRWFALGMLLAVTAPRLAHLPRRGLAVVSVAAIAAGVVTYRANLPPLMHDVIWGAGFTAGILALLHSPAGSRNVVTSRPIIAVGRWSYSLYAMHYPLLVLLFSGFAAAGVTGRVLPPLLVVTGLPLSLLLAAACYRYVERPSLARARRPVAA